MGLTCYQYYQLIMVSNPKSKIDGLAHNSELLTVCLRKRRGVQSAASITGHVCSVRAAAVGRHLQTTDCYGCCSASEGRQLDWEKVNHCRKRPFISDEKLILMLNGLS